MKTTKKDTWNSNSTKKQKGSKIGTTIREDKVQNQTNSNVSVFTKTNNPKVVIQAEKLNNNWNNFYWENLNTHKLIKFTCIIIMCLIILMIFFLSLRTYNTINELSDYVQMNLQP